MCGDTKDRPDDPHFFVQINAVSVTFLSADSGVTQSTGRLINLKTRSVVLPKKVIFMSSFFTCFPQ